MPTISSRKLGKSGIEVSPIGMGCWAIGGPWELMGKPAGWGKVDDAESMRAIHAALDCGINFFDTAANYGAGHSERILGQALAGRRREAVIATKFGFVVDEAGKRVSRFRSDDDVIKDARLSCEASLRRLGTDYIDLFQLHVWDYPIDRAAELRETLEGLVREGKIRGYAWSTDDPKRAQAFAEGEHCTAVQHDLNVILDAPEMLALCVGQNLASVNRSPLARGALTGKYSKGTVFSQDDVRTDSWSREHFFAPKLDKLEALRSILTSGGRTLAQGALAWVLTRSQMTVPIPGFRTVKQVKENAGTLQMGLLMPEQMSQIDALLGRPQASVTQ
jgi:aryl-alcohol dehydrogenase-like predicted oxidoreductase